MADKKLNSETVRSVWNLCNPIAKDLGLEIWDVRFQKEGPNWYLRIFIDKDNGVTIDDCENMSRAIDKPLDNLDPINISYCLEVSSPGLERELTRPEHFKKYIESEVIIRFIRPIDNNVKEIKGILMNYNNNEIEIKTFDKNTIKVNKKQIAFVKLNDFE